MILLPQEILDACEFPVKILFGLTKTHSGLLIHETFCFHAGLDVDLSFSTHHDEHQSESKGSPENNRHDVVFELHTVRACRTTS